MGLLDRKKSNYYESQPFYTLGQSKTLLVVGLGNIGKKYDNTRHNFGFMAVDRYRESHDLPDWTDKKDLQCHLSMGNIGDTRVLLIKPTTLMNLSGQAMQKIQSFYKISNADTLVIYDDLDIDFGVLRSRLEGSAGGHNGIKDIIKHTDKTFGRIKAGIGPKEPEQMDSADFVLQNFNKDQKEILPKILREICALIDERTVGPLLDNSISVI